MNITKAFVTFHLLDIFEVLKQAQNLISEQYFQVQHRPHNVPAVAE